MLLDSASRRRDSVDVPWLWVIAGTSADRSRRRRVAPPVGPWRALVLVPVSQGERGITMRFAPTANVRSTNTRNPKRSTLRLSRNGFATWEFAPLQ